MQEHRQLRGSMVALVTPMKSDGSIDYRAWEKLLDYQLQAETDAVVVSGTTGESACLDKQEIAELLRIAVQVMADESVAVICGVGGASTLTTMKMADMAVSNGADAILAVTPYYNRPPQRGLLAHYTALADHSDLPIILYNVPSRTGTDLLPETTVELAAHPNIVSLKEAKSAPQRLMELKQLLEKAAVQDFTLLSGDDNSCCHTMLNGMHGVISVATNIVPKLMKRLSESALSGNREVALELQQQLQPLFELLSWEGNPIAVKWCLHERGIIGDGIRLPLVWFSAEAQQKARPILNKIMQLEDSL